MTTTTETVRIPVSLQNEIRDSEAGSEVTYRGEFFNVSAYGSTDFLLGNAYIEKIVAGQQRWIVYAIKENNRGVVFYYIVGLVSVDRTNRASYRDRRVEEAENQGIPLSTELLDRVFGPLEKQYLKLWERLHM